jgi:hypothetical protein
MDREKKEWWSVIRPRHTASTTRYLGAAQTGPLAAPATSRPARIRPVLRLVPRQQPPQDDCVHKDSDWE